jgi:hypothetical protein
MRQRLRMNALCAFMAGAGCAIMAWLGLYGFAWNDYDNEARPAFEALIQGHVLGFLRLAPAYGGSLIERAPFALLPGLWGGGALAVYRTVALPCLAAGAVLGLYLVARMRAEGRSSLAKAVALGVCVANPITLRALELGHPEELLGACLCVAAVFLGARDLPLAAGVLLGLAVANKEWALLAAGPVLLVLPPGRRRLICLTGMLASTGAVLLPLALASGGFVAKTSATATPPSEIFQPWQVWWFLGHHGALVLGAFRTAKPGFRTAPSWVHLVSHPLIPVAGILVAGALWLGRRRLDLRQALLALALVLLLRCLLDTWDTVYYPLPFVLALLSWEVTGQSEHPPVLALTASVLVWLSFQWLPGHVSPDWQAALFLAWSLPLAGALSLRLFAHEPGPHAVGGPRTRTPSAQPTTVSSLERLVRTS